QRFGEDKASSAMLALGIKAIHHAETTAGLETEGGSWVVFDEAVIGKREEMNTGETIDALNRRIETLVQDPDVAYAMQTKRYSLMKASYAPTPSSSENVFVANAENVGPIKRAFIASAKDGDGSYLMKVLDHDIRGDVADATVLT